MLGTPPKVSVITATYNWSSVLRVAIQSLLRQTVQDFEMLVIGDGCTDDTADVVASFNDPRLRWHNLPENSGSQSVPNNKGLELARGQVIAYLGHDDLWYPTHLENGLTVLKASGADFAYSLCAMIGPPGSGIYEMEGLTHPGQSYRVGVYPPSCTIHTRALARDIGGWRDYRETYLGPAQDFQYRAFVAGKQFIATNDLTTFKFPAKWRKDVYQIRSAGEQVAYLDRMRDEPDFRYHELLAYLQARAEGKTGRQFRRRRFLSPPGTMIEEQRAFRGLPAKELRKRSINDVLWLFRYGVGKALYTLKTRLTRR